MNGQGQAAEGQLRVLSSCTKRPAGPIAGIVKPRLEPQRRLTGLARSASTGKVGAWPRWIGFDPAGWRADL